MSALWLVPVALVTASAGVVGACAAWIHDESRRVAAAAERVESSVGR